MKRSSDIEIKGAREHNLQNLSLNIPRRKITVITGLSGSGKSSLAFDTVYAEGQRRYVESLSAYARNFLDQLKKPDVDSISGLSPAIAIEQKTTSLNPRSTVGTVTEVYDYFRLLYARLGIPHCPKHGSQLKGQAPGEVIAEIMSLPVGTRFHILSPVVRDRKGEFLAEFQKWQKKGFVRARIDGVYTELSQAVKLQKTKSHTIDLLIDRLEMKKGIESRVAEAVHLALQHSTDLVLVENLTTKTENLYALNAVCNKCGFSLPELEPRMFSFNNPKGACSACDGLGYLAPTEVEAGESSDEDDSEAGRFDELKLVTCPACHGDRLRPEFSFVKIKGHSLPHLSRLPISELNQLFATLTWTHREEQIANKTIKQIKDRIQYLNDLGVGYLSISRSTRTLSGGESQRIRLATQLGNQLVGILYVLDEPSIGLHPRDHRRLLETLKQLRDRGNTILMVEHDEDTIRFADHVIDIGPGAGETGGKILVSGTPAEIESSPLSITGPFLSGRRHVVDARKRSLPSKENWLRLYGARGNNLKDVNLEVPLGVLTCVTGVSGSGKSTLILDTLYKNLSNHFYRSGWGVAPFKKIEGVEKLDRVVNIDQRPIGRTPRSNPATYVGLFTLIRELYAQLPDARLRGYNGGRFSFNVKGGRCEACQGGGSIRVEMHFMADVFVQCEVCVGKRYNRETLAIKYRDKSIADVLDMSVGEALAFFEHHPVIHRKLQTLSDVGLDYIRVGQSSTTLSGGEAQRIKLSKELSRRLESKSLYILDEPTTGLHFEDIRKLISLLHRLVDNGSSVIVIEHNTDVARSADHIIDLGPEGGAAGGQIIAVGTPDEIKKTKKSLTGQFL
jgi:excinuclease ABC subunit A